MVNGRRAELSYLGPQLLQHHSAALQHSSILDRRHVMLVTLATHPSCFNALGA